VHRHKLLRRLRRLLPAQRPDRPLSWTAAERLAIAQARELSYLAHHSGQDAAEFVSALRVCTIRFAPDFPRASASFWSPRHHRWVIIVRQNDPEPVRRMGVLREFKHILDHGMNHRLYDPRHPYGTVQAAMAADCFATRALMPDRAFRRIYQATRTISKVARHFGADEEHVLTRLSELQLAEQRPGTESGRR
jgi:Zn-dependent peptidase ImmA (M78 family)